MPDNKQGSGRGFASMDEDKQREIASQGGKASGGNFGNCKDALRRFRFGRASKLCLRNLRVFDACARDAFEQCLPTWGVSELRCRENSALGERRA